MIVNYVTTDWRAREQLAFPDRTKLVWDAVWELGVRHETIARGQLIVVPSVTRAT